MRKQTTNISDPETLRNMAEKKLKQKVSKHPVPVSESEILRLNNELSVHQIELEIQNEELMNTKQELEATVEKYVDLYEFAPSGYITVGKNKKITDCNHAAAKMLGNQRSNIINKTFDFFIFEESLPELGKFLKDIFDCQPNKSCEVVFKRPDGIPLYAYLVGHITASGQCNISLIDITERKNAESKLRKTLWELTTANKIKNERETELVKVNSELASAVQINSETNRFISILAHDLRSPFSVIMGYSELLCDSLPKLEPEEIRKIADEIQKSTKYTFNLLEDLLKWARMQSGRIPFKPQKLDLRDILHDLAESVFTEASAKNISIRYSFPAGIDITADSEMLKTIVRNLISNAIKFTNQDGEIKVSAEQTASNIMFSVTDNGVGMKQENIEKLFNFSEFQTLSNTSGEKEMGLGLFLCKGFVEKHGGKIWAESIFGKGSFFYFTIPNGTTTDHEEISTKPAQINSFNLKVLIADDNDSLRMILGEFMKKYSREILFARNGSEAVDLFMKNSNVDLILMDYFMPDMNGYESTRQIRLQSKDVVIFVETSDTLSNIQDEFAGVKIDDFLPKPYSRSHLEELIRKHFGEKS